MDKIIKFLRKRSKKERLILQSAIRLIVERKTDGLDIKKIVGSKNIFRVRVGAFRIIFEKHESENFIRFVGLRNESTYKNID